MEDLNAINDACLQLDEAMLRISGTKWIFHVHAHIYVHSLGRLSTQTVHMCRVVSTGLEASDVQVMWQIRIICHDTSYIF
jgi:hypothetical protein